MAQFDDGKEQSALRTIGEVADALGIRQHVLRYWEQQFPMLQPLKRSGGRRYYRPHDVALVEAINRLVNHEGYTLKGAKKALSQKGTMTDSSPSEPEAEVKEQVADPSPPPLVASRGFPFASELPDDGGLEAFFGAPASDAGAAPEAVSDLFADTAREPEPAPVPEPQPAQADKAELIAALKSMRARLAATLPA